MEWMKTCMQERKQMGSDKNKKEKKNDNKVPRRQNKSKAHRPNANDDVPEWQS